MEQNWNFKVPDHRQWDNYRSQGHSPSRTFQRWPDWPHAVRETVLETRKKVISESGLQCWIRNNLAGIPKATFLHDSTLGLETRPSLPPGTTQQFWKSMASLGCQKTEHQTGIQKQALPGCTGGTCTNMYLLLLNPPSLLVRRDRNMLEGDVAVLRSEWSQHWALMGVDENIQLLHLEAAGSARHCFKTNRTLHCQR